MYGGLPGVKEMIKSMRVQGSGFRVQGSGFRVQDSGFRVSPWGVLSLECVRKLYSPVRSEE